ncbi:S4 domain-containing protein [Enterobacteriaceae endosymbiont of Neohaemonia nigricornis]|uniref:S4 domain-containing protein n=1 Tax=Enterobacteriaceae endosymbiont of Neohaemonia nigricornis TaxID=2675792 RepID=UPI001ABF2567|nr:S4 domain-containing protein [Enterobacteriaceae endosymbiont of Neohaemonia nigricornis]
MIKFKYKIIVNKIEKNIRLDYFLSTKLKSFSRNQIKSWIINNYITINNHIINIPKKKFYYMIKLKLMLI